MVLVICHDYGDVVVLSGGYVESRKLDVRDLRRW